MIKRNSQHLMTSEGKAFAEPKENIGEDYRLIANKFLERWEGIPLRLAMLPFAKMLGNGDRWQTSSESVSGEKKLMNGKA